MRSRLAAEICPPLLRFLHVATGARRDSAASRESNTGLDDPRHRLSIAACFASRAFLARLHPIKPYPATGSYTWIDI